MAVENEIVVPRGTNKDLTVSFYIGDSTTPYHILTGDKVYFTVKSNTKKNSKVFLSKVLTDDDYNESDELVLSFNVEDTEDLQEFTYRYDCGVDFAEGGFYIFIEDSPFTISPALSEVGGTE
jgi:hypothetical protein